MVGGHQSAHRVPEARRGVHVDQRRVSGPLGEALRHPEHRRLLQPQDVGEVVGEVFEERQLGGARVTEDRRHPELAQEIQGDLANRSHKPYLPSNSLPCGPIYQRYGRASL